MPARCVCPPGCLSVCLFVRLSRSCILSKRVNVSAKVFHHRVATPFQFFPTKSYGNIPTGPPKGGVECRWGRQKSLFSANIWLSERGWWSASNNCDGPPYSLPHRPPPISVSIDDHEGTPQHLIVHSGKSEPIIEDCDRRLYY